MSGARSVKAVQACAKASRDANVGIYVVSPNGLIVGRGRFCCRVKKEEGDSSRDI